MHIRQSIYIEAAPVIAMEAARAWMINELQPADAPNLLAMAEISDGITADGAPSLTTRIDQDGIVITTHVFATNHLSGSKMTMELRTEGKDVGSRLRNLSLFPGRRLLTRQVRHSLLDIRERANP